ncbi:MAG TPA: hypothetical protein VFL38_18490 [Humibacillus xanthopallidus]|nr:hypothetical protein [Humibacillus xanthopallidus]
MSHLSTATLIGAEPVDHLVIALCFAFVLGNDATRPAPKRRPSGH